MHKGSRGAASANWSFTSEREVAARDFQRACAAAKRDSAPCVSARVAFYGFPHSCISHGRVSTNIPRKPGGMKSFAPFWLFRRHDERFVEPTWKIFSSYRRARAMKNIERHLGTLPRLKKIASLVVNFSFAIYLHSFRSAA